MTELIEKPFFVVEALFVIKNTFSVAADSPAEAELEVTKLVKPDVPFFQVLKVSLMSDDDKQEVIKNYYSGEPASELEEAVAVNDEKKVLN